MQVNTIEAPPVGEWLRQKRDDQTLRRLAAARSIRYARRPGVLGWLKARLGLR